MDRLWRSISSSEVLLEDFGEFVACYDRRSNQTHILDALPSEILLVLRRRGSCTEGEMAVLLEEPLECSREQAASMVARVLHRLSLIDLVVRIEDADS